MVSVPKAIRSVKEEAPVPPLETGRTWPKLRLVMVVVAKVEVPVTERVPVKLPLVKEGEALTAKDIVPAVLVAIVMLEPAERLPTVQAVPLLIKSWPLLMGAVMMPVPPLLVVRGLDNERLVIVALATVRLLKLAVVAFNVPLVKVKPAKAGEEVVVTDWSMEELPKRYRVLLLP